MGTTEALFGRRDAALLLLTAAGLSYRAIAVLDRIDALLARTLDLLEQHTSDDYRE